jgi:hypothetical protein
MADIMDAEETVDLIERRSAAVAEWASRTMCQKEHWDTDGPGATSGVKPGRSNAKATEPGRVLERRILDPKNEDEIRDDVDAAERVKIRYNGMSQWDHQTVADNQDPAIDSNMDARGPSTNPLAVWKGDWTQQEPADKTRREQVILLEAMGKFKGKLSIEEREAKTLEEMSNGPLSILTASVKKQTGADQLPPQQEVAG